MATNEKMTVHKALSELKIIDSKINKLINGATYVMAVKHSATKINGVAITDYKKKMISDYDKVVSQIKRKNALKRAVVMSNAVTKVTINGEEFTVAEAIEMKNHGMEFNKKLLSAMTYSNDGALSELNKYTGENMEKKAEQYVLNFLGTQGSKDKSKLESEEIKLIRKTYIENNTYDLLDPLNISEKMETLSEMIDSFMTEVDAALSVSNALTIIEVTY